MSSLQISAILDKLDELRALFVLGQRAIPFLEEMFGFLQEISSLLDDINASIRESTIKMMPNATSRLESVTQATEMATTEILDLVDGALGSVGKLKGRLQESQEPVEAIARADARMIRLLRRSLRNTDDMLLAKIEIIHHEKKALRRKVGEQIRADLDALNAISEKLNLIMLALQVQDITAQQLAAVNHLIESIRDRLGSLMKRLGSGIISEETRDTPRRFAAFDPNATYDKTGQKQRAADALMAAYDESEAPAPSSPASQGDIDQLFNGGGTPLVKSDEGASASQDAIDQLFGSGAPAPIAEDREPISGGGSTSQDDIDQLFNGAGGGLASQDDIDKLFGA